MNMNLEWPNSIEKDAAFEEWLESVVFPEEFDSKAFPASDTLYHVDIHESALEDAIHVGIPAAGFTKSELNDAILQSALQFFGHADTKWFHVNVHDGVARVVEKFGRYSFDFPLVPVYIMLNHHKAEEGGSTYSGLVSARKEWLLLFDSGFDISLHGTSGFVSLVKSRLRRI